MAAFRGPSPGTGGASSPISENGAGYEWSSMRQTPQPGPPFHQSEPAFKSDLLDELNRTVNHNAIVTDAPKERFRLGYFDVACLVINRIIGKSPSVETIYPLLQASNTSVTTRNGNLQQPNDGNKGHAKHRRGIAALVLWHILCSRRSPRLRRVRPQRASLCH